MASMLHNELYKIVDELGPKNRVQISRKKLAFLNNDLLDKMTAVDSMLTAAIRFRDQNDWRTHNHTCNKLYKNIDAATAEFFADQLNNSQICCKGIGLQHQL